MPPLRWCCVVRSRRRTKIHGASIPMLPAQLQTVLTQQPLGLAFDIDGTLSPIAPTPEAACLYTGVADLLTKAQTRAHVAIMTGRAVNDGAAMVNVEGL